MIDDDDVPGPDPMPEILAPGLLRDLDGNLFEYRHEIALRRRARAERQQQQQQQGPPVFPPPIPVEQYWDRNSRLVVTPELGDPDGPGLQLRHLLWWMAVSAAVTAAFCWIIG